MLLRLYLLVDESRVGPFRRLGSRQREVRAFITQQILPNIGSSMPKEYLSESYPWSFVISSETLQKQYNYAGAFMVIRGEQGKTSLIVVYGLVTSPWLKKNMHSEFPLTFLAARILNNVQKNDLSEKNWRPLWQWVNALNRAYLPFWESFILRPVWRFKNHSQVLLREGGPGDYHIRSIDGVEFMPWKNWPDCIQQEASIWIWRQSRHGKILDSKRIPLRSTKATP